MPNHVFSIRDTINFVININLSEIQFKENK